MRVQSGAFQRCTNALHVCEGQLGLFEEELAHEVVVLVRLGLLHEVLGKLQLDPLLQRGGDAVFRHEVLLRLLLLLKLRRSAVLLFGLLLLLLLLLLGLLLLLLLLLSASTSLLLRAVLLLFLLVDLVVRGGVLLLLIQRLEGDVEDLYEEELGVHTVLDLLLLCFCDLC